MLRGKQLGTQSERRETKPLRNERNEMDCFVSSSETNFHVVIERQMVVCCHFHVQEQIYWILRNPIKVKSKLATQRSVSKVKTKHVECHCKLFCFGHIACVFVHIENKKQNKKKITNQNLAGIRLSCDIRCA